MVRSSKNNVGLLAVIAAGILTLIGSAANQPAPYVPPRVGTASNQYFDATVTAGSTAFDLTIKNKTDKDLEIDWNKTLYIDSGTTSGGFMFEGVVYMKRNDPKPPDVVFAHGTFSKIIYPNNLVSFVSGRYGGWTNGSLGFGETGVYLTVGVEGKEMHEKIIVK